MREIKFRAWDIPFKRMKVTGMGLNQGVLAGEDVKIMQYTGLKDCKGREIYEGDIVKVPVAQKAMAVFYQPPSFVMKEKIKSGWSKHWAEFILHYEQNQFVEVIGNIYENPELIEVKP